MRAARGMWVEVVHWSPSFSAEVAKDISAQQSRIGEPRLYIMNIDAVRGGGSGGSDRPAALPQVKRS